MSLKEELNKEMADLTKIKKPYESAAFILFAILLLQQLIYLFRNLLVLIIGNVTFLSANGWCTSNLMGFVARILGIDSTNWFYIILSILAYFVYYFLIYYFVWNYARKHNLAKWTWTLFIVFGPTVLLIPPYIFFVVYAYRVYLVRFAKRVAKEFKDYDPDKPLPEEIVKEEPAAQ